MARASRPISEAIAANALDPAGWQGVTDAVAADFTGANFVLVGNDLSIRRSITGAFAGYSPESIASHEAHFAAVNPYHGTWATLPAGRIVHSAELMAEEDLLRPEDRHDWLRPQGHLRDAMGAVLARDPGRLFIFNCHLELRAAPRLEARLARSLRRSAPLLQRRLEISRAFLGLWLDSTLLRLGVAPEDAAIPILGARACRPASGSAPPRRPWRWSWQVGPPSPASPGRGACPARPCAIRSGGRWGSASPDGRPTSCARMQDEPTSVRGAGWATGSSEFGARVLGLRKARVVVDPYCWSLLLRA